MINCKCVADTNCAVAIYAVVDEIPPYEKNTDEFAMFIDDIVIFKVVGNSGTFLLGEFFGQNMLYVLKQMIQAEYYELPSLTL